MKKVLKKLAVSALAVTMCASSVAGLVACGGGDEGETYEPITGQIKVGVLTASDLGSDAEAQGFKTYLENYVASNYNATFTYSAQLSDAAAAKTQTETWASQNYNVIIDMANQDRLGLADYCNDNGVYYVVATGVMTDSDFATAKNFKYFLGQVGPDSAAEYEAGLKMGQYYSSKNISKIAFYGAFLPNVMHENRLAGIITGLGGTYDGASGTAIASKIVADQGVSENKISIPNKTVKYWGGMDFTTFGGVMGWQPDAVLGVGVLTSIFGNSLNGASVEYADIASFNYSYTDPTYGETLGTVDAMSNGSLKYLAGKYASSVGPVWALIQSAANGTPIRDNGKAVSVKQGFKVVTTATEAAEYAETTGYVWTKTVLDSIIQTKDKTVSLSSFKTLVENDGKNA